MQNINIYSNKCVHDSQEFGSNNSHIISRVYFNLQVDDKGFSDLSVDISHQSSDLFNATNLKIENYCGPQDLSSFDYEVLNDSIEYYYRDLMTHEIMTSMVNSTEMRIRNLSLIKKEVIAIIHITQKQLLTPDDGNVIKNMVDNLIFNGHKRFVLSLKEVEYLTTVILGMLISIHKKLTNLNVHLSLARLNPEVRELMTVTRLQTVFTIV